MLRELAAMLLLVTCATLASRGAATSELPPLRCSTVRAPGATCAWVPGGACTWEEGGTPTVCAPISGATIQLRTAGTYRAGYNNASAASAVAFDAKTRRLFVANGATQSIDLVNLGGGAVDADRPRRLTKECSIDVANPGLPPAPAGYTPFHVALRKDGILAVVLQDREDATRQGGVAFYDARADCDASPLSVIGVGFMPARAGFTPDGEYLLVTNEGEPSQDYLTDPLGSVSIVDLRPGIAGATATEVTFEEFDPLKKWLIDRGVRITGLDFSTPEPHATTSVARDLEPEGIAVSADSRIAWVTLPENNAVAVLDIRGGKFLTIRSFGHKDYGVEGNGLDPTDNDGPPPNIQTWPMRGMYMPKQVAIATPIGFPVFVYPDRGVRRNLDVFGDEIRLSGMPNVEKPPGVLRDLDPAVFPPGDPTTVAIRNLQLKVSWVDGDSNNDGFLEHIYAFGGRSFSIRSPDNRLIFDSGDDFEQITAQAWRDTARYFPFNTPDDENGFDDNSDLRGPEPVSVATGRMGLRTYAFVGLERVGGVMTYDITNPFRPRFQHYINNRNFALNPKDGKGVCTKRQAETAECANVGDQSAQEIVFVGARESPIGAPLLVVGNVTSGSATILRIDGAGG